MELKYYIITPSGEPLTYPSNTSLGDPIIEFDDFDSAVSYLGAEKGYTIVHTIYDGAVKNLTKGDK